MNIKGSQSKSILKKKYECQECFDEFKTPKGLKNHKCLGALDSILTSTKSKEEGLQNHQKKGVTFAKESLTNCGFECKFCSKHFDHRRFYLLHLKKCKSRENQSLSSHIDAIYEEVIRRKF